jgi:hypothetical protein
LNDWHRFVVNHPDFAACLNGWLTDGPADNADIWRETLFYACLATAFEFQMAQEVRQPVLLDEGFGQRLFTLRGYHGLAQAGDAIAYARYMPRPTGLVWVNSPPHICLDRLRRRPALPLLLQGEPDSLLVQRLEEGHALLESLFVELTNQGVPTIQVDGAGDLEAEAARIADFAAGCLRE